MPDFDPRKLESLSAQFEGLEAAADGLVADPGVAVSIRRIARSLQSGAEGMGAIEVAAGAQAIQRASDDHLARSVRNFLDRVEELRAQAPSPDVTILLVEDNKTVAAATTAYLKSDERTIVVAESAAEAEEILATQDIGLVVLDLILPDRDGRDLLIQMRERERTAVVPVIVLSAQGGSVARAECIAVGADDFLEKPADPKELRAAVLKHLRHGITRREPLRDGLTGLANRAGIAASFDEIMERNDGGLVAVVRIGVEVLDAVVRALGRNAADRFLLELSSQLFDSLGPPHLLGRWERTELVAILPGANEASAREKIGAALQAVADGDGLEFVRDAGVELTFGGGLAIAGPGESLRDTLVGMERFVFGAHEAGIPDSDEVDLEFKRVFVVEDDRTTATLLHHRLVRDGYEVFDFLNGEEAYEWAKASDFDIAILDVKVPGIDGFELLERLRGIDRFGSVPIIMLTGMGSEADVIRGLELGANDYMLKPFSPSELLARVRRLLTARHREASIPARRPAQAGTPD